MSVKPFQKIAWLGVVVILMSVLLLLVYPTRAPWLPPGFTSPALAFEFIETPQEVRQLFGVASGPIDVVMLRAMNRGNTLDFLYMLTYTAFLGWFALKCAQLTTARWYYTDVGLAGLMLFGDGLENVQLFSITSKLASGDFTRELAVLHLCTWLKWGSLAIFFLVLVPYFFKSPRWIKIIGVLSVFPAISAVIAYFHRSVWNEILTYAIALMFVSLIVYSFRQH
jgi:hypothetical protein